MFSLNFMKVASEALMAIDKFFNSKGLSHGRFLVLMVLAEAGEGGLFPYEIADLTGVSRATASGLVKGLQTSELVGAKASESDGRMKKIALTEEGEKLLTDLYPEYYQLLSSFTTGLDKKTLKQFSEIFGKLASNVKPAE